MKNNVLIFLFLIYFVYSFHSINNSRKIKIYHRNFPTGLTVSGYAGAPGDQETCNNCHVGTSGTITPNSSANSLTLWQNGIEVSEYVPGVTYQVKLRLISNPFKKGFQATACAGTERVGEFYSDASNTTVTSSDVIASHANNEGIDEWTWNWVAPNSNMGDIIFYVSTIHFINGSGQINQSQHNFQCNENLEYHLLNISNKYSTYYDEKLESLILNLETLKFKNASFDIFSLTGEKIFESNNIDNSIPKIICPVKNFKEGLYIVNLRLDGNVKTQKIWIGNKN